MNSYNILPDNYVLAYEIDLDKNKKLAFKVYLLFFIIAIIMVLIAIPFKPFNETFKFVAETSSLLNLSLKVLVTAIGLVVYVILHELIHALFFKIFGSNKINFGLTLKYAYARSDAYYPKLKYIIIGLAPVVLLGILLIIACFLVPTDWFWVVYIVTINNFSGASGDFYVTFKLLFDKRNLLIYDYGTSMKIYAEN